MDNAQEQENEAAGTDARQALMAACARATIAEMAAAVAAHADAVANADDLRAPETGLVMLRGRIGGSGAPFNVGEASVTRAAIRLADGTVGFGYQLGRSHERARLAALIDALGQDGARRERLRHQFLIPVMARAGGDDAAVAADVAATRVDFFTVARGED